MNEKLSSASENRCLKIDLCGTFESPRRWSFSFLCKKQKERRKGKLHTNSSDILEAERFQFIYGVKNFRQSHHFKKEIAEWKIPMRLLTMASFFPFSLPFLILIKKKNKNQKVRDSMFHWSLIESINLHHLQKFDTDLPLLLHFPGVLSCNSLLMTARCNYDRKQSLASALTFRRTSSFFICFSL